MRGAPILLLLLLFAGVARAETLAYAEAGGEALGGQAYALVEPGLEWRADRVHLALGAVLRMNERGLRPGDFDELSEYGAVLRRMQVGEDGESFQLLAGSGPSITLGRGGIVDGLEPSLDPDHGRAGAYLRFTSGDLALSAMAQDILSARVFGTRAEWAPGEVVRLGATWAFDPQALISSGPVTALVGPELEPVHVVGADVSVVAVRERGISLAPFVEVDGIVDSGLGLGAGLGADLDLGGGTLAISAEYRRLGRGYVPRYFDAFYEVERRAYPRLHSPPKLAFARTSSPGNGMALEARFTAGAFAAHAGVEGRGGGPVAADLGVDLTTGDFSLSARAARRGALDVADLLDLSGELWALAEARFVLTPGVYAFGTAGQLYSAAARFEPIVEASLGLGVIGSP